jgi:hypothetical protein
MFNSKFLQFFILIAVISLASSCVKKEKFTRQGWDAGDGISFPKRYAMVDDLLANQKLKGLTYKQVVQLLKAPQTNSRTDKSFSYEITRKMSGIDTMYAKSLVFYLNNDSVVVNTKITERDYIKEKKEREKKAKNK